MTNLTPEQRVLGRENADRALGVSRRDLLKAAAAAPALGRFYFGYEGMGGKSAGQGGDHRHRRRRLPGDDPLAQPRLPRLHRLLRHPAVAARAGRQGILEPQSTTRAADVKKLKRYDTKEEMYDDPDVEMIVIALPLWLHAPVAIEAMKHGKHVFTEKLMAHSVAECKEMCQVARETNRLLAVGHQRHYSVLYDNANYLVQNGVLGDIRHIRALWHRNNATPMVARTRTTTRSSTPRPASPRSCTTSTARSSIAIAGSESTTIDKNIDYKKYGYQSLDELINWRLYNRTGAGLMAELGSHQLDACSIFLDKKHPLAVTGIGGTFFYTDGREVDDHVFTALRVPRQGRERPDRGHLFVDQHQLVRRLRRDGDGLGGDDDRQPGERDPALQGGRQPEPVAHDERHGRGRRERSRSGDQPEHGRPDRRGGAGRPGDGRSLARLSRRARALRLLRAPRRSPRTITTTRITSRAAAARLRWPTPSSRSPATSPCGRTAGSSSTRAGSTTSRPRPRNALRPSPGRPDPELLSFVRPRSKRRIDPAMPQPIASTKLRGCP